VRQLASGRWQARYLDAAGVRHTAPRTFLTKVEATRCLALVEADLLRGSWADPKLGRVTFGEWVEQWRPTTASLRPGTLVLYDYLLRRFLLPAFGSVLLDGLRVHDLRHTAATLAAAAGATTKELMERMGHTSPAVALRYQHVMADRQAALASALDDLVRVVVAPAKGTPRARKGTQRARRRR
jgi:hypothetical protein